MAPASHWFYRYRLYHLPFWMVYHLFWWSLYTGSVWLALDALSSGFSATKFMGYVIAQALGVYFNLYYLMPHYLERGRYAVYFPALVATIAVTAVLTLTGYYVAAWQTQSTVVELFDVRAPVFWTLLLNNSLPSAAASATLAMSIKLGKNYLVARSRQQDLEKENLRMELQLLKSQLSPHFLFNSINSIFVLIHKSPDRASESLARFSQLLRYQLYECEERQIEVGRELAYVEGFIELETLRQDRHLETDVDFRSSPEPGTVIAPGLLLPLIENGFKHVSQHMDSSNWIHLQLSIKGKLLQLRVRNTYLEGPPKDVGRVGGVGLPNVRRRLELLYPDRHQLVIQQQDGVYDVRLDLQLAATGGVLQQPGVLESTTVR